jgi:hypothetical protein
MMKKTFLLLTALVLLAGCDTGTGGGTEDNAPKLTIRNESSYDLTNVRWVDKSFISSGQDLLKTTSSTQAGKEGDSGYIFFVRKDIGVELRTAAVVSIPETETFRFLDNTLVIEVANTGSPKPLSEITSTQIRIGDTGPGGGIVFSVDARNNGWEVSGKLSGLYTWSAAKTAASSFTGGGFSDWYLPSMEELGDIYLNLQEAGIANLGSDPYWSASEYDTNDAWLLYFSGGERKSESKDSTFSVRAVRDF